MKTLHVVLLAGGLALAGAGAFVFVRGRRSIANTDPLRAEVRPFVDVMTAGVKAIVTPIAEATPAAAIDEATATSGVAIDGVSPDAFDQPIAGRYIGIADRFEDFAVAGIFADPSALSSIR
jgi:hypothetical protein